MIEVSMQSKLRPEILASTQALFDIEGMRKGPRALKASRPPKPLKPPHFIKEWRIFRDMTVEELAARSGLAVGTISAIENRSAGFSPESLEAIAGALRVPSGYLLSINPNDEDSIWPVWEAAGPSQRGQITALARVVVKTGK